MNSIINLGALVFLIVAGMRKSGVGRITSIGSIHSIVASLYMCEIWKLRSTGLGRPPRTASRSNRSFSRRSRTRFTPSPPVGREISGAARYKSSRRCTHHNAGIIRLDGKAAWVFGWSMKNAHCSLKNAHCSHDNSNIA